MAAETCNTLLSHSQVGLLKTWRGGVVLCKAGQMGDLNRNKTWISFFFRKDTVTTKSKPKAAGRLAQSLCQVEDLTGAPALLLLIFY